MRLTPLAGFVFLILISMGLPSCKPPAPASGVSEIEQIFEIPSDVADYASAVIDDFYDYDLEAVRARLELPVADLISIDELEALADSAHETAQPQSKRLMGYGNNKGSPEANVRTSAKIIYFIPNEAGYEEVRLWLTYDNDGCCRLIDFDLQTGLTNPARPESSGPKP